MGLGKKHDYPPLLAPGRHVMSVISVKQLFVNPFKDSERRVHLYNRLEEFIQALLVSGIACEVWLDGSFLTEKKEPSDLDVTVILDADVGESLTDAQNELINTIADGEFAKDVDSFAFVKRRRDDPYFGDEMTDAAFSWGQQYGLECSECYLKGFVVMKLRETNVGLRICS